MQIRTWQYLVLGFLILTLAGITALDAWLTPYNLAHERTAARAAGLPLTPAELVRLRPAPGQDAGPDWLALTDEIEKHKLDTSAIETSVGKNGLLAPSGDAAVRRLMAQRPEVFARIHKAAARPDAYFEHKFTADELFPYFVQMRQAAKLLRWESIGLARQGRFAEAVRTQELGLNIADQLASEPTIIGMLVSIAIDALSTRGMEDVLREAGPNAGVARLVAQALRRHPSKANLAYSLKGETLFGVTAIRSITSPAQLAILTGTSPGTIPSNGHPSPLFRHIVLEPSEAVYLHWMTREYQAAKLPRRERDAAMDQINREIEKAGRSRRPAFMLTSMLLPVFSKAGTRVDAIQAQHAVLLAAAEALDYRARTGAFPAALTGALKDAPIDPFTDKPIGYRREGVGFVVYSVGADGTFQARPGQKEKRQALFRYPKELSLGPPTEVGG